MFKIAFMISKFLAVKLRILVELFDNEELDVLFDAVLVKRSAGPVATTCICRSNEDSSYDECVLLPVDLVE